MQIAVLSFLKNLAEFRLSKRNWIAAGAFGIGLAAAFLYREYVRIIEQKTFFVTLQRDASELNATLPEMVSRGVRLDEVVAGPGNSFNYIYTILDDASANDIAGDATRIDELKTQMKERVCSTMPSYRKNRVIINYFLRSNAGDLVADISIDPKDC